MPAKSKAQARYMGMCAHLDHPPKSCPDRATAREFARKPVGKALPERKGTRP